MKNKIIQILVFIIFMSLIFNSIIVTDELKNALNIFFSTLFPSIFPFFLISNLLIEYNFVYTLNKVFYNLIKKLFHSSNTSSFIIIMSMLSGFPSGSKYIKTMYNKNLLSLDEANYLITFTHFANPLFVLTVTRNIINNRLAIYILLSMYLSNIIIGIIIRPNHYIKENNIKINTNPNFSNALSSSIKDSFNLLIIILGNTCFFFLVTRLIDYYLPLNNFSQTIVNGFFDITKGINSIKYLSVNNTFKGILVLTFIGFGGINIHMQVKSIIADTKIKYINFLLGRICQVAISSFLFILFKTYLGIY